MELRCFLRHASHLCRTSRIQHQLLKFDGLASFSQISRRSGMLTRGMPSQLYVQPFCRVRALLGHAQYSATLRGRRAAAREGIWCFRLRKFVAPAYLWTVVRSVGVLPSEAATGDYANLQHHVLNVAVPTSSLKW